MDQAKRGAEALSAGDYAGAIKEYTAAISATPTSPDYFIKRSTAYQRSSPPDFAAALSDAETAVVLAQKRAKRELIVQAQLRRGIALFGLERYGDAEFVMGVVKRMDPKEKTLMIWEKKIADKLAAVEDGEDIRKQITAKETPEVDLIKESSKSTNGSKSTTTTAPTKQEPPAAPAQTPSNKIRHDWYQNADNVYFTLLAKGVPKDKATIDIQPRSLSISFPLITSSTYDFSLEPLFAAIDVSNSSYSIMSTKIEVVLKKAQPGQKWHGLEGNEPISTDTSTSTPAVAAPASSTAPSVPATAPSYPTSSRSGPKDWDKLASTLTTKKPKPSNPSSTSTTTDTSAAEEEQDDDYTSDNEGGDAVNAFFKKLYKGASPDVRRAMMKSYTESNGTALSTNWDEVSKGTVETSPPDGVEARKW